MPGRLCIYPGSDFVSHSLISWYSVTRSALSFQPFLLLLVLMRLHGSLLAAAISRTAASCRCYCAYTASRSFSRGCEDGKTLLRRVTEAFAIIFLYHMSIMEFRRRRRCAGSAVLAIIFLATLSNGGTYTFFYPSIVADSVLRRRTKG